MIYRITIGIFFGTLLLTPVASAEEPTSRSPEARAELFRRNRAAEPKRRAERIRNLAKKEAAKPPRLVRETKIRARVERVDDGLLWVSLPVSPTKAAHLLRLGYSRASTPEQVGERTILNNRRYEIYPIEKRSLTEQLARSRIGSEVDVTLRRVDREGPRVLRISP